MKLRFRLSNGKKTFFQWDVGQKIILENPICNQVHFENKDISDKAYVKDVYKNDNGQSVVDVPDIFLQYTPGFLIYGYIVDDNGKGRYTEERGDISVIRRAKPSDYVFTPEDQKTLESCFADAVKYTSEERTDEEKAIARENIGAESVENKVNEIGDDDTHYPTVGAVKTELDKKIDNPQAASVGEVLTVEEVDENGRPTKWKTAPAASEQVQADWQENDETAASYVKNRPGGYMVKQAKKTTVTVPADEQNGDDFAAFPPFEVGDTVNITINGTEYSLVARRPDDLPDELKVALIGDAPDAETLEFGWSFFRNYTDSDDEIISFVNFTAADMTLQWDIGEEDVPVKFDPKYIDYPSVPQSDWAENDETSPAFVKNRPFYAEVGEQVVGSGFTGWNLTTSSRDDGIISKVKINDIIYENISPLGDPSYSFVSYNIGEWSITFLKNYQRVSISPDTIADSDILFLDTATNYHTIPEEYIPALSEIRNDIGLMRNHMYFGTVFSSRSKTSVDLSNASRQDFILLIQTDQTLGKLKYTSASPDGINYYDIISSKTGVKITEDEIPYGVMALYHNSSKYICINPI